MKYKDTKSSGDTAAIYYYIPFLQFTKKYETPKGTPLLFTIAYHLTNLCKSMEEKNMKGNCQPELERWAIVGSLYGRLVTEYCHTRK